eukprot:UN16312
MCVTTFYTLQTFRRHTKTSNYSTSNRTVYTHTRCRKVNSNNPPLNAVQHTTPKVYCVQHK